MDWRQFFDGKHAIYVSDRHREVHDREIAEGILAHLDRPGLTLLDYACGEASQADRVAAKVGKLILCDGAASIVQRLRERFAANPDVIALLPEEMDQVADGSVDIVICSSLIQYLSREQFEGLLDLWKAKLKPEGRVVLADVIPPAVSIITDASALLGNGLRHGYFLAACVGLLATFFSPYRRLRAQIGLSFYEEAEMIALFRQHGFDAARHRPNIGLSQHRMCFVARPR